MVSFGDLIKRHRERVLVKQKKQTQLLEKKLKTEQKEMGKYIQKKSEINRYKIELEKQKQQQKKAKELQTKLKGIRSAGRQEKIKKLKEFSKRYAKSIGSDMGRLGRGISGDIKKVQDIMKKAEAKGKRRKTMLKKKRSTGKKRTTAKKRKR